MSDNNKDIVLISKEGMSIRFNEQEVNAMGRVSGGVRGIQLRDGDEVVAALWVENDEGEILTITDLGYGKRSLDYQTQSRGGKGMATFEFKEGKRVKPNGAPLSVLSIAVNRADYGVQRRWASPSDSHRKVPIAERKSIGKLLADVGKQGRIVDLVTLPHAESGQES